ncbi:MAG TPA: glutamate formimidoyltransferase [Terrisporobacter glycolicus]|uniref:glutamate formimidoyltransferase n=1 Tax=Terrisporobacter petrolearius TaxID=1460447 RepID=A0ABZ3FJ36_9FIRM|nr:MULTISPECIES: glutamate formimidoyltransferase [Terrisporobacter]MBN9646889.1 glutamate formimidoyltransferase [Terrisporobacter glycolicus]UPA29893.1 glutamate formimidoyltransferase [Terrisporobacter glycolicus]SFI94577.1 glutamate formiminotransferase [Terrisporobacter glycolicus]HBI94158.1 glutamate formimidoyltransferase [Terrisporobacter hibernicus]
MAIVQCVPNFSEGVDLEKIEKIVNPLRGVPGVKLLNYEADKDYNRVVVTVIGEPQAVKKAVFEAIGVASEVIDMNNHKGQHSRFGACDVCPFIPIKGMTMEDAVALSKELGEMVGQSYNIPVFLYEASATKPERENLAVVRKGEYEGLDEKLKDPAWEPDFGPAKKHPTAGAIAIGARKPLIAYNINLDTPNIEIASKIAKTIRHSSGGYRYIKAGPVEVPERNITQVTMNLTDYSKTAIYRAFEAVKMEARRYGVNVTGSEIVGLCPMEALIDTAAYYLGLENFSLDKVL